MSKAFAPAQSCKSTQKAFRINKTVKKYRKHLIGWSEHSDLYTIDMDGRSAISAEGIFQS